MTYLAKPKLHHPTLPTNRLGAGRVIARRQCNEYRANFTCGNQPLPCNQLVHQFQSSPNV